MELVQTLAQRIVSTLHFCFENAVLKLPLQMFAGNDIARLTEVQIQKLSCGTKAGWSRIIKQLATLPLCLRNQNQVIHAASVRCVLKVHNEETPKDRQQLFTLARPVKLVAAVDEACEV